MVSYPENSTNEQPIVLGSVKEIFQDAETAAGSNEAVMILGETGVGKEILARFIHAHSRRRERPFLPINCAAIPGNLFESELFGYQRGAFTGAVQDKKSILEEGQAGTVFLDEITEIPLETQAKLLRVIETRELMPVGGTRYRKIDVRFITATNAEIKPRLEAGQFRRDLYYRLSIFLYHIPPLRQRPGDIPLFTRHFIQEAGRQVEVSPRVMELFLCYPWPGNVRELKSAVTHGLAKCRSSVLELEHLPPSIVESCPRSQVLMREDLKEKVECFEARLLKEALHGPADLKEVADRLGINLRSLYRKLKKYGLATRPAKVR